MSLLVQRKLFHREWQVSSRQRLSMTTTEMGAPISVVYRYLPALQKRIFNRQRNRVTGLQRVGLH